MEEDRKFDEHEQEPTKEETLHLMGKKFAEGMRKMVNEHQDVVIELGLKFLNRCSMAAILRCDEKYDIATTLNPTVLFYESLEVANEALKSFEKVQWMKLKDRFDHSDESEGDADKPDETNGSDD